MGGLIGGLLHRRSTQKLSTTRLQSNAAASGILTNPTFMINTADVVANAHTPDISDEPLPALPSTLERYDQVVAPFPGHDYEAFASPTVSTATLTSMRQVFVNHAYSEHVHADAHQSRDATVSASSVRLDDDMYVATSLEPQVETFKGFQPDPTAEYATFDRGAALYGASNTDALGSEYATLQRQPRSAAE
jgi:hypothetical protein